MSKRAEAIRLYCEGLRPYQIAPRVGMAQSTVQQWIRRWKQDAGVYTSKENTLRPLQPVPRDTRTPGQRIMGDPLFERSALYQKMQGEA